jgi:hypothetical protein
VYKTCKFPEDGQQLQPKNVGALITNKNGVEQLNVKLYVQLQGKCAAFECAPSNLLLFS